MSKQWYFDTVSREYGTEQFGPYSSAEEAEEGIKRVQGQAKRLADGVRRSYTEPYPQRTV